jgi:hypothetical protein
MSALYTLAVFALLIYLHRGYGESRLIACLAMSLSYSSIAYACLYLEVVFKLATYSLAHTILIYTVEKRDWYLLPPLYLLNTSLYISAVVLLVIELAKKKRRETKKEVAA